MSVVPVAGSAALPPESEQNAEAYETKHVHEVYETIAPHFSATRFKPWPIVERFLLSRPIGSVGLDIGCGNGKYLGVNPDVFMIGSDRSSNLAKIGHTERGHDTLVCDALDLPHPLRSFDFAISIAVIHHFSSRTRRVAAIRSILSILKTKASTAAGEAVSGEEDRDAGKALIYVWAQEQKASRRGWDENTPQDMFVPWVLQKKAPQQKKSQTSGPRSKPKDSKEESKTALQQTGEEGSISPESLEMSSAKQPDGTRQCDSNITKGETDKSLQPPVFMRYYHLFRKGELEEDIAEAGGVVCESGYEKDNWWAIMRPDMKSECSK